MVLNKIYKRFSAFVLLALISVSGLFATAVPALKGRVNDYANIISNQGEEEISRYLADLEATTGIQIAVLTMPGLGGEDIASFAFRVCDKWELGQKGKDNGALLLVDMANRNIRIETGYGLEDKLTDAKCGLIIRNVIVPELKNGNYSKGILKGVQNMGGIASDNAELVSSAVLNEDDSSEIGMIYIILWLLFVMFILSLRTGILPWILFGNRHHRYRRGPTFMFFPGGSSFGGSSHSHSGFSSGSFGGGFSGGGGHFGGGGASGHF